MIAHIPQKEVNYNLREGAKRSYVSFRKFNKIKKNKALIKKQKRVSIKNQLELPDTTEEIIVTNVQIEVNTIHPPFIIIPQKIQYESLFNQESKQQFSQFCHSKQLDLFEYLLDDQQTINFNI